MGSGVGGAVTVGITVAVRDGVGETVTVGAGVSVGVGVLVGARVAVAVGSGTGVAATVGVNVAALKVVARGSVVGVRPGILSVGGIPLATSTVLSTSLISGSLEQATDTMSSSVASTVTRRTRVLTSCGLMIRIIPTVPLEGVSKVPSPLRGKVRMGVNCTDVHLVRPYKRPHPNPLPEGEGTLETPS